MGGIMGLTRPTLLCIEGTAVVNIRLSVLVQHYGRNVECEQWCVRTKAVLLFKGQRRCQRPQVFQGIRVPDVGCCSSDYSDPLESPSKTHIEKNCFRTRIREVLAYQTLTRSLL